jgi:hypothetical protein
VSAGVHQEPLVFGGTHSSPRRKPGSSVLQYVTY